MLTLLLAVLPLASVWASGSHFQSHRMIARAVSNKCAAYAPLLPSSTIRKVKANLAANANISDIWVVGTQLQALTEYDIPQVSVFDCEFYNNLLLAPPNGMHETNDIVDDYLALLNPTDVEFAVVQGGAAADPASLGVSWLNDAYSTSRQDKKTKLLSYAQREVDYLLKTVPRHDGKAISHRPPSEGAQLWDDFVYMVPPFLAYYGVLTHDRTTALEAWNQIAYYRHYLRDSSGLWHHILYGSFNDTTFWGTGMAWSVAGMARVYATYKHAPAAANIGDFSVQMGKIRQFLNELLAAMLKQIRTDGLLPNVYYPSASTTNFGDSASSALIASTIYRLAQLDILDDKTAKLALAEKMRKAVYGKLNQKSAWLDSAADPLKWYVPTSTSPESMAFLLLLDAAARDYKATIGCPAV